MSHASVRATRVDALDAWRALLMVGGVFVHGSTLLDADPLLSGIQMLSHLFRVGTFYALAGYLSALAIARHGGLSWTTRRLRQIGVPLVVGLAVVSPLVWLLIATAPGVHALPLPFEWHHLWFLVGLLVYCPVAAGLDAADRRWHLAGQICARYGHHKRTARLLLLLFVAAAAMLIQLGRVATVAALPPRWQAPFDNAGLILGYVSLFAFGFTMARCAVLRHRLVTDCRAATFVLALVVGVYVGLEQGGSEGSFSALHQLFRVVAWALCPALVFVLVLRSSLVIRHVPEFVLRLADASYTIYLLHFPLIVAINAQLARVGWHPQVKYLLAVGLTTMLCYRFHVAVVRENRVAALLLNGRLLDVDRSRLDRLLVQWSAYGKPAGPVRRPYRYGRGGVPRRT